MLRVNPLTQRVVTPMPQHGNGGCRHHPMDKREREPVRNHHPGRGVPEAPMTTA